MIVVNARIEATQEDIAALTDAILTMEQASQAEEGCHDYTFSIELGNPNALRITEKWESMAALEAHFATPHMAAFQQAMAANPPKGVAATFYDATEVPGPGS